MSKFAGLGGRLYRGETSVDFIGKRRRWYAISAVLIIASALALSLQGLHLGIEFKGGSSFTVTKTGVTIESARSALSTVNVPGPISISGRSPGSDAIRKAKRQRGSNPHMLTNAAAPDFRDPSSHRT